VEGVAVANLVGFCIGDAIVGGFFLLSLSMQQVLGCSPIEAGVAFLATKTSSRKAPHRGVALTRSFDWAFWVGSTFAIVGLAVTLLILRRSDVPSVPAA
jgi:hypothetical protein